MLIAGCTGPQPDPVTPGSVRPLEILPAGADLRAVRADLLATARERYGAAAVERALAAPTHLIVKRFVGMSPPPPPGAGPDWRAPTPSALLIRDGGAWRTATPDGWRPARADAAARLDALLADARLRTEPAYTPPCPDFGASNLVLKLPGQPEAVRNALCSSAAADLVEAALQS